MLRSTPLRVILPVPRGLLLQYFCRTKGFHYKPPPYREALGNRVLHIYTSLTYDNEGLIRTL